MIIKFDELDQQWALDSATKLETKLFASQAWDKETLRSEVTDPSRIYLADVTDVTEVNVANAAADSTNDARDIREHAQAQKQQLQRSTAGTIMRGYAGMWHADGGAEITTIGVAKRFQRNGVAKGLLGRLIHLARLQGIRRIKLEVRVDNEPAKRLYHGFGFKDIGLLRHYYQPEDVDAIEMALDLEPHIMGFNSEKQNMEQHQ
ncbi:MAG: ribosomal protein S18-alanine N-acetyltransferase [Bifidobacterium sp.]|nr:ribosomal protein S18-alanine N-acetyltransferase [Bifidobacterium sp.]